MKENSRIFALFVKQPGAKVPVCQIAILEDPTPERIANVRKHHPDALDLTPTRIAAAVWRAVGRRNSQHPF